MCSPVGTKNVWDNLAPVPKGLNNIAQGLRVAGEFHEPEPSYTLGSAHTKSTTLTRLFGYCNATQASHATILVARPTLFTRIFAWFRRGSQATQIGHYWEGQAARYLRGEGYRIIVRNWRARRSRGEVDIVAWDGPSLVFVEVRARQHDARTPGYHSIDRHKRTVLRKACTEYLFSLNPRVAIYRFDVVQIAYSSKADFKLSHFKNVPLFGRQ